MSAVTNPWHPATPDSATNSARNGESSSTSLPLSEKWHRRPTAAEPREDLPVSDDLVGYTLSLHPCQGNPDQTECFGRELDEDETFRWLREQVTSAGSESTNLPTSFEILVVDSRNLKSNTSGRVPEGVKLLLSSLGIKARKLDIACKLSFTHNTCALSPGNLSLVDQNSLGVGSNIFFFWAKKRCGVSESRLFVIVVSNPFEFRIILGTLDQEVAELRDIVDHLAQHPRLAELLVIRTNIQSLRRLATEGKSSNTILDWVLSTGFHLYDTNGKRKQIEELPIGSLLKASSELVSASSNISDFIARCQGLISFIKFVKQLTDSSASRSLDHLQDEASKRVELRLLSALCQAESLEASFRYSKDTANTLILGINNYITQKEQALSKQIAQQSARLAEASWKDTTSVTAITLITLIFIPPTFIATGFQVFYEINHSSGTDQMLKHLGIFFAMALPLTIVVVGTWYLWVKHRRRATTKQLSKTERDVGEDEGERTSRVRRGAGLVEAVMRRRRPGRRQSDAGLEMGDLSQGSSSAS